MNNFTKEELETIKHGIDWVFEHQNFKDKPPVLILGRKIQSMIENYCEHKKVVPNYDCKSQCDKCGLIL